MTITITVRANGPLLISPSDAEQLQLVDYKGNEFPRPEPGKALKLCRCGESENKPYCDASHVRIGFTGTEMPQPMLELPASQQTNGASDSAST